MQEPQVHPGQLTTRDDPNGAGVERTVHGEFVGGRGELASYAFGWTVGPNESTGKLTIGIGAGNPGGGTFHISVFAHEGSYAMALVDEPFADVPEGGPDLRREAALEHEDLPFVWFVADQVMYRDPSAWWMRHWIIQTHAVATPQVLERVEPVLRIQQDDDGIWQAIGSTDAGSDGGVLHVSHLVDDDSSLVEVLDLAPGSGAWRSSATSPWTRFVIGVEDNQQPRRRPRRRRKH